MTTYPSSTREASERARRTSQIVQDVIARRSAGDAVSDDSLVAAHPDLMPDLGESLRALRIVERAERQAGDSGLRSSSALFASDMPGFDSALPSANSFPGYEIVGELRRGGQGVVYQAVQHGTQRDVAIKVMREGPFASPQGRARFEREVEILARLRHPNIVAIHHTGAAYGGSYFVMDYISGLPQDEYLGNAEKSKSRKVETGEMLKLFVRICEAVNAAHLIGVIHRDLKPSNILVDESGEPHVLDFGLARLTDEAETIRNPQSDLSAVAEIRNLTCTGQFIGSLPWASPEQAEGVTEQIDLRTDVYSLGVMLYHSLCGCFPYTVTGAPREALGNILEAEPASLRESGRFIDDEVETMVLKCLAKDRERRYQSAGELARDIRRYLTGEAIEAKRDSTWYVLRKAIRRYRVHAAVAAMILALVATAAIALSVMYTRQGRLLATSERQTRRAERTQEYLERILGAVTEATQGSDAALKRMVLADLVKTVNAELADEPEVEAAVRDTIGRTYQRLALYEDAETHLRAALDLRRQLFGRDHLQTADSLYRLAELLKDRTRIAEAEPLLNEALDIRRKQLGDGHPDVAATLDSLGAVRQHHDDFAGAEALHREALAIARKQYGDEHIDVARSLGQLGLLYTNQERYAAAESHTREALEINTKLLGQEHPDTAGSQINLAKILHVTGDYAEAEPLFRQAIATHRKLLGDEHDNVAWGLHRLGLLLQAQGEYVEAEASLRQALSIYRGTQESDDPYIARVLNSLGTLLLDLGRYDEAEPLFEEAMVIWTKRRGDDSDFLAWNLNRMGELRELQKNHAGAEPLLREALARRGERGHFEHAYLVRTLHSLARLLVARGDAEEAERLAQEAYEFRRDLVGEDHPETAACRRFLDWVHSQ